MKILMVLTGIFISEMSLAQKIQEATFDKRDSVYTVKTSTETIGTRIVASSNDIKALKFCIYHQKSVASRWRNDPPFDAVLYFFFQPDAVMSMNGGTSSIKVTFEDSEVVQYKDEGDKRLVGTNQTAVIYFTAFESDKLFTTSIRSVKISVSSGEEVEFVIDNKKKHTVKNALQLLQKQSMSLP